MGLEIKLDFVAYNIFNYFFKEFFLYYFLTVLINLGLTF